ncbi:hypothetical protein I4F81_012031 [Pyropia yezoensis]|uniref:Uncharacterized protein n=1 Tax=Pyropia yezoensis TaxID=2788 RepID=A0ACC3CH78_PYRYE|nr:hypothetical protein I4F81_012031 [Neopyropia yezoensis]
MALPSGIHHTPTTYADRLSDGRDGEPCTYPFPSATLSHIAASAVVAPSQLSLLEASAVAFDAVLDYAGRYPQAPVTVATGPLRARWVNPQDSWEWAGDPGSDVDDDERAEAIAAAVKAHGLAEEADDRDAAQVLARPLPRKNDCGEVSLLRNVVLVSTEADGEAVLLDFVQGVMNWRRELYEQVPRPMMFDLHRFRTDSEGGYSYLESEGSKHGRLLSSVILPDGMAEAVLDDVRSFLSSSAKAWYRRHGLPYRRSYLFHGTPGSGKTSTIRAIASTFGLQACFLSVTNAKFNNQVLADAVNSLPSRALLVIEDVDALFSADRLATGAAGSMTFSGLLNCLDGLTAAESVLVAMTTNKDVCELDPALVRGGRVDRRWAFSAPDKAQLVRLFSSYYPEADASTGSAFADALVAGLGADKVSMAAAQQLFIYMRLATPAQCVAGVPSFCAEYLTGRAVAAEEAAAASAAAAAATEAGDGDGKDPDFDECALAEEDEEED